MSTTITILKSIKPKLLWEPEHKEVTEEFLRSKAKDPDGPTYEDLTLGANSVLYEAQRILGRCLPPTAVSGRETGLVVGYVQSGKTLSFETVISLARDNGYGMVVVFAGTKKNLREQSEERLRKDLGINDGETWVHVSNPTKAEISHIESKLTAWRKRPSNKAVLITVLKQADHLNNLAMVLKKVSLDSVPVLIIDDESDQASLNTNAARIRTNQVAANTRSTIYDRICAVRDVVPHHSLLQYTATPQANLLLAQADLLNPSFAELVTPGPGYTGGQAFFLDSTSLTVDIPAIQVPSSANLVTTTPKTLLSALRYFLLVCAQHSLTPREKGKDRNRSMMVHPAMQTQSHKTYKTWVDKAFITLKGVIEKQYKIEPSAVEGKFQGEYASLLKTYPSIKPLSELVGAIQDDVLDDMRIVLINGTPDAEKKVDWKSSRYWILVGGAKLDRGYTVEGLAITYMPRPLSGSPAADTLQQRARFFGYKKSYFPLCRVFLQGDVKQAFTDYVKHEDFVRSALDKHRGKPLKEWRRDFILDEMLSPTRPNVVGLGTRRVAVKGWMVPGALQRDASAAEANRQLLVSVEQQWKKLFGPATNAAEFPQFKGTKSHSPNFIIEAVPLRSVLEDFLLKLEVRDPGDAEEHSAVLIGLADLLRDSPDLKTDVVLMNNLLPQYRSRVAGRGFDANHPYAPMNFYFSQSADAINDKTFCSEKRITLQLRRFNLGHIARDHSSADIKDVTWFALHVPKHLAKDLHVEERVA
jgi:hypothetical protein